MTKISDDLLQYCLEDGFRGDALRSSVFNMILSMAKEIKEYRNSVRPKQERPDVCHESHKSVRSSDASTFDFICDDCGATDCVTGGWGTLRKPCKGENNVSI
jgi:hypothetical protein